MALPRPTRFETRANFMARGRRNASVRQMARQRVLGGRSMLEMTTATVAPQPGGSLITSPGVLEVEDAEVRAAIEAQIDAMVRQILEGLWSSQQRRFEAERVLGVETGATARARAMEVYEASPVNFDGTNDFLSRDAGLTGAADGKEFTLSTWLRITDLTSVPRLIQNDLGATNFRVRIDTDGSVEVNAANTSGVGILAIDTAAGVIVEDEWAHLYMGFNLADGTQRFIRKNGEDISLTVNTYDDQAMDLTAGDWFIGANQTGTVSFAGDMADYQLSFSYIDDLARFYSNGSPVEPDADGMIILLTGDTDEWHINDGSGGGMTENGALTDGTGPVEVSD